KKAVKSTIVPTVIKRRLFCTLIQKQVTICLYSTDVATVKVIVRTTSTRIWTGTQKQFGNRNRATVRNYQTIGSQSEKRQYHSPHLNPYFLTLTHSNKHYSPNAMKRTRLYRTYFTGYNFPLKLMRLQRLFSCTDWVRLQMVTEQGQILFLLLIQRAM